MKPHRDAVRSKDNDKVTRGGRPAPRGDRAIHAVDTAAPLSSRRWLVGLALAFLVGCTGNPLTVETAARQRTAEIGHVYRPHGENPALPTLDRDSAATEYVRFALFKHPQIAAAFQDWRASVESITTARSRPDPKLTFEADITDTLMTFMPGLMADIMTGGKRAALGREAAATSEISYRAYVSQLVTTATQVRKAWVDLSYIDEALTLRNQAVGVVDLSLAIAQSDYTTGRGMATLEAQWRFLNGGAKLKVEIASLADQRLAARARFKAALGLRRDESDPPWPVQPFPSAALPDEAVLWQQVLVANPQLGSMRAMVEMAIAAVEVARRTKTPDYTAGFMADLKAEPLMIRPTATMTLPIWRDKIAAVIGSAEARRLAAESRLDAEQIGLAAEFAQILFMVREAERMAAYLDGIALPNTARALASSEAAYQSGLSGFAPLAEFQFMQLDLQLERAAARRQRETALAELSLLVAGQLPSDGLVTAVALSK